MVNLYVSYRSQDRSQVREIEQELYSEGLNHVLVDDIDDGDLRSKGFKYYWNNLLKTKLETCSALILLIGDTTHTPREALSREIKYAKSQPWYIFGVYLSQRTGEAPEEVRSYKHFIPLDHDPALIVSEIEDRI